MAQYEQRTKTINRYEYVLPNPANHAEIGKALSAAYQDYKLATDRSVSDDAVWITHADDEIIIYWEEKK
jgi:hypothetical protein